MTLYKLPKKFHPDFKNTKIKPVGDVEVDWDSPLAKGVDAIYFVKNNVVIDMVTNKPASMGVTDGTPTFNPQGINLGLNQNIEILSDSGRLDATGAYSIALVGAWTGVFDEFGGLFIKRSVGDTTQYGLQRNSNSNQLSIFHANDSASSILSGIFLTDLNDEQQVISYSWDTARVQTYLDGDQRIDSSYTTTPAAGSSSLILNSERTRDRECEGNYRMLIKWNRAISSSMHKLLSENPYSILKPKTPSTYFTPSGATGISITEQTVNTNYAAIDPIITLTGSISITETLVNTNYATLDPTIDLTGLVSIVESLVNTNYTALNPSITLTPTGVIVINEQLVNTNYTSLNPTIDLTGLVDITESLVNTNYEAKNPTITLTSGAIEIIEQTVGTQYQAKNPSILLTPEPLGIVSTVCFDGVLVDLIYNGINIDLNFSGQSINLEFNGQFNELEFNGTIQTICNPGNIKTNC